ncbi:MAG TPA: helix-turn-helix transcriptional regulator [Armatimonadota bacterium]|nr:helix-turn-helix transcriptional regulator [Armatimonadota bacterium]
MAKTTTVLLPLVQRRLTSLGENLRLARLRRELSAEMVAERAGISRQTLSSLENGSGSVSMATYVQVLFVLGLEKDLDLLARDDELGRKLQDAKLPIRVRARKHPKAVGDAAQA